jgi:hypothetical protein
MWERSPLRLITPRRLVLLVQVMDTGGGIKSRVANFFEPLPHFTTDGHGLFYRGAVDRRSL